MFASLTCAVVCFSDVRDWRACLFCCCFVVLCRSCLDMRWAVHLDSDRPPVSTETPLVWMFVYGISDVLYKQAVYWCPRPAEHQTNSIHYTNSMRNSRKSLARVYDTKQNKYSARHVTKFSGYRTEQNLTYDTHATGQHKDVLARL